MHPFAALPNLERLSLLMPAQIFLENKLSSREDCFITDLTPNIHKCYTMVISYLHPTNFACVAYTIKTAQRALVICTARVNQYARHALNMYFTYRELTYAVLKFKTSIFKFLSDDKNETSVVLDQFPVQLLL
jgi:hypothetical protein